MCITFRKIIKRTCLTDILRSTIAVLGPLRVTHNFQPCCCELKWLDKRDFLIVVLAKELLFNSLLTYSVFFKRKKTTKNYKQCTKVSRVNWL